MTLDGHLPVPTLSAEVNEHGDVAILVDTRSERDRELAYATRARRNIHHCSHCSSTEHNVRRCPRRRT